MSSVAISPAAAVGPLRLRRPGPWASTLVAALTVAVVAGGSVAATQVVMTHRLDQVSVQLDQQRARSTALQDQVAALGRQLSAAERSAASRAAASDAQLSSLRQSLAAEQLRAAQADAAILTRLPHP